MTEDEKLIYKKLLEELLVVTKGQIASLEDATQVISPDNAIGRVSRMDAIGNKAVNDSALQRTKSKINSLEISLESYGSFMFGCCDSCGMDISFKRLQAMPEVSICMNCAS